MKKTCVYMGKLYDHKDVKTKSTTTQEPIEQYKTSKGSFCLNGADEIDYQTGENPLFLG